jgi:CoA:oxalate CoA-transferase
MTERSDENAQGRDRGGQGPLAGFLILDLTRVLAGPYCTMILADLGATVIKVEQPGTGDDSRQFLLFVDGKSAYFARANRGKKSIALDLKSPDDRQVFEKLAARADVLVENFRPGVMEKLGYDWPFLERLNPGLVFASISGFGQTGPYRSRPAFDLIVQAMSGMMSMTGFPGLPPARAGTSIGDVAAGVFCAIGVQSALLQRVRTGHGTRVDISMLDCQIALLENAIAQLDSAGASPGPMGAAHPGSAPFDAFRATDGFLVITAGTEDLFRRFCALLGIPELPESERFRDRKSRVANAAELKRLIEDRLAQDTVAGWLARLDTAGIPAGPVYDVSEMLADSHVVARGAVARIEDDRTLRFPVTPIALSAYPYPAVLPHVPELNEHREEILKMIE